MRRRAVIAGAECRLDRDNMGAGRPGYWVPEWRSQDEASGDTAAFLQGLKEMGYTAGRNVALEYRWAEGQNELLPNLAADLVQRQVAVLAAVGGNNSALAAKRLTATIPIVFTSSADPVLVALVDSLSHPGGNVTGVSWFDAELGPKQLKLLSELVPDVKVVVLIVNPRVPKLPTSGTLRRRRRAHSAGNCMSSRPAPIMKSMQP